MLKQQRLQENTVLNIKLRPSLFTLVQLRRNTLIQCFDIRSESGEWHDIDLDKVKTLFFAFASIKNFKTIICNTMTTEAVTPSRAAIQMEMLSAIIGSNGNYGAKLIRLSDSFSDWGGTILKESLSVPADLDIIYSRELTGMLGDAEKLRNRLIRYFETGVNFDDSKSLLFKGIPLPPPGVIHG